MKFILEIEMEGAAFDGELIANLELRRMLDTAARQVYACADVLSTDASRPLLDINGNTRGGWKVVDETGSPFWTHTEWVEWSNSLAELLPEGDESEYSNPEAGQESIIYDCLAAYVRERAS